MIGKNYLKYIFIFLILLFPFDSYAEETISGEYGDYDTASKIIQEVMKDFYLREDRIQYNYSRASYGGNSPEEATFQDNKHLVCASYTFSSYKEAFGVLSNVNEFPMYNYSITDAASAYYQTNKNNTEMLDGHYLIYYEKKATNSSEGIKYILNNKISASDFAKQIKPGDLFTYTGHAMIAYKVLERTNGNWDVLMLNATGGSSVPTRIDGTSKIFHNMTASSHGIVPDLHVDREGTIKYFWLSENSNFVKNGQISCKKAECSTIRPFYKSNNNKAIFNVKITPSQYQKSLLRLQYPGVFIEKTVDKIDNNSVFLNDELEYTINIVNKSNSSGSGSAYNQFYIIEELGDYVSYISSDGILENNKIIFTIDSLGIGDTITLKYKVKVNNNYDNIGSIITSIGSLKSNLDSDVSLTTGIVENKIIPKTKNIKKSYAECFNELKGLHSNLALIDAIYECSYEKNFDFSFFNFEELFHKKVIKSKGSANAIVFQDNLNEKNQYFQKMILNNLWSGIVELNSNATDEEDSASDEGEDSIYTLSRWSGNVSSTRARNIHPKFFKEGDVLIYKIDYNNTKSSLIHTKESGVYAYIYLNGSFVGINGSGESQRNHFTSQYYTDKSLSIASHLYTGYENLTEDNKEKILEYLNYETLFDKDYYVVLRPEMVIQEKAEMIIAKEPTKLTYNLNEKTINLSGGEMKIYYNDGSSIILPMDNSQITTTGFITEKTGKKTITLNYEGLTTSFVINVVGNAPENQKTQIVQVADTAAYKSILTIIIGIILITVGFLIMIKLGLTSEKKTL